MCMFDEREISWENNIGEENLNKIKKEENDGSKPLYPLFKNHEHYKTMGIIMETNVWLMVS